MHWRTLTRCRGRFAVLETALAAALTAAVVVAAPSRPVQAEADSATSCLQTGARAPAAGACRGVVRSIGAIPRTVAATPAGRALLALGAPLAERRDWAGALKLYGAALEQEPDNARLHQLVGQIHDARGRHREAQRIYLSALDRNPRHGGLFDSLDRSLMRSEAARSATPVVPPKGADGQRRPYSPSLIASHEVGLSSAPTDLVRNDLELADALDLINPLHHLPVVGMLYRRETGDRLDGVTKVIGGGLFGGPFGLFAAALEHAVEQSSGQEVGAAIVRDFFGAPGEASEAVAALPVKAQPLR